MAAIVKKYSVDCLELYCKVDEAVRKQRYITRNESGERHKGHVDTVNYADFEQTVTTTERDPLAIGRVIEVDTGVFGDAEYQQLKSEVRQFLEQ